MDLHYHCAMTPILEAEARLTAQNQITIPAPIRKALKLTGGKSRIKFQISKDGKVLVARVDPPAKEDEDPALKPFLNLLAKHMQAHPERIMPFPVSILERARSAVEGVDVDLDGPLTGDD
jgi:antitoxin PrlF